MNALLKDIAFAWRGALKQPGTSLLIVMTLALGIGVNTAMFSMGFQVVLGSLPYANGDEIVQLDQTMSIGNRNWSVPTMTDVGAQTTSFAGVAGYSQLPYAIQGPQGPVQVMGAAVNWNFFELFGVQPLHGRDFEPGDDMAGAAPVVLLSYEFWNSEYGGDPAAVGSNLEIMRVLYEVVGVMPALPPFPHADAVWIPASTDPYRAYDPDADTDRGDRPLQFVFARLHDAAGISGAGNELEAVAQRLAMAYPDNIYPADYGIAVRPLREVLVSDADAALALLAALSFLVLAISGANIANLMLGRTLARSQELAIREAVGASPATIRRQLLVESVLFSAVGGVVALGIAYACLRMLTDFAAGYTPLASGIRMGGSVLLFALGTVVAMGCFIGVMSALIERDINRCLKEGGDKVTTSSLGLKKRRLLLLTQYVLAFVMLTTSMLIVSSLYRLQEQDTGYDASQILVVNLPLSLKPGDNRRVMVGDFSRQLLDKVRAVPGVNGAAVISGEPLLQRVAYMSLIHPFYIEDRVLADGDVPTALRKGVSDGFFAALGIPLLRGRGFAASDDEDALPVVIVSDSLARRYFPAGDALGQRIRFGRVGGAWLTIVGVVADIRSQGLDRSDRAAIYTSYWQSYSESLSLYVNSAGNLDALAAIATTIIRDLNPRQPVERAVALDSLRSEWMAPARLRAIAIALFGALALLVTFSGVIGVVSYNVNQRVREVGIHMAIGATPANVLRLFLADGLKVYAAGLLLGVAAMLACVPLLEPLLYETAAMDIGLYAASAAVLTLAVAVAMYLPARRAATLSPVAALHFE